MDNVSYCYFYISSRGQEICFYRDKDTSRSRGLTLG